MFMTTDKKIEEETKKEVGVGVAAEDRFGIEASCWVYPRPFKQDISVVASITSTLVICLVSFVCVSVVGFFVLFFYMTLSRAQRKTYFVSASTTWWLGTVVQFFFLGPLLGPGLHTVCVWA